MSCQTLIGIVKTCDNNTGGIARIFINRQDQIDQTSIDYAPAPNDYLIDQISLIGGGDAFEEMEFRRNVSSYTEEAAIDLINGSSYITQTITLMFHRREHLKSKAIKILGAGQDYLAAVVLDMNGKYWYFPDLQLTGTGEGSGTARADGSKYSVTLTAENENLAHEIDDAVAEALVGI